MNRKVCRTGRPVRMGLASALVLIAAAAHTLHAQQTHPLTLEEAIRAALEHNLDLKRSSNQVVAGRLSVRQARADFYPNLSASASASQSYSRHADSTTGQTEGRDSRGLSLRLSSNVGLFSGFSNVASLEKSGLDLAADEKTFWRSRQSVTFETISGFLEILQNKELLRSEEEHLRAQREQLKRIEELYKSGNRSIADVLQQQATIAQAELRVLGAQRSLGVSTLRLQDTIGLEPTAPLEVVEPSAEQLDQLGSDLADSNATQLVAKALAHRADVQAQNTRINAAVQQLRVARAGYWPSLSLSLGGGSSYSSVDELGFSDQFLDTRPDASVGLSLSIPVFDRLRTKNNVAQARVQLANERLTLKSLRQNVAFEARQALLDYQTAAKELQAADAQLRFARQALEAAEERYNVGASTLVELAQSRAQYVEAANDRIRAHYGLLLSRIAADYYQGDMDRVAAVFERS